MKKFIKKNWKWAVCIFTVFLCCLLLPFSGDDLDWGMKSISEFGSMLINPGLNGRYVGNFVVIIVTKNIIVRSLVTSLVLTGIVYFIKNETRVPSEYIWLLFMAMPVGLFMQGVTWASGFVNYTISTLFLLYALKYIQDLYNGTEEKFATVKASIMVFLTSFFLENITLFLLMLTVLVNVVYIFKNKRVNKNLLVVLGISILGTVLMFIQPTYHMVATGEDTYRSIPRGLLDLLKVPIINYTNFIHKYVAYENIFLLSLVSIGLFINFKKEKNINGKKKKFLNWTFYYSLAYIVFVVLSLFNPDFIILKDHQLYLNGFLAGLYILVILIQIWLLFFKKSAFWKLALPLLCIAGIIAPLCFVSPLGPRNFFVVYVLEMILAFYILNEANLDYEKFKGLIRTGLVVMVLYYMFIYYKITMVNIQRDNYIKYMSRNTQDTTFIVPSIPFDEFVHYDNFSDKYMTKVYNTNKGIREDVMYVFIPYDEWLEKVKREGYTP